MIRIGITGGIGSGKSIVCKILSIYNIPIYDADKEAKNINNNSPIVRSKLIERFGEELYKNSELDRKMLANHIFNNEDDLKYVNNLIHTELAKHFKKWIEERRDNYDILAIDAAVLFEAGFQKYVDKSITVVAPINLRIKRVMKRDNLSLEQINSRLNSQLSDEQRVELSDFVIINDENQSLIEQTSELIKNIGKSLQDCNTDS